MILNQSQYTKDVVLDGWYPGSLGPGEEAQIFHAGSILEARTVRPLSLDGTKLSTEDDRQYAYDIQVPDYRIGDIPTAVITLY